MKPSFSMLLVAALGATIALGGTHPTPPPKGRKAKAVAKRPAARPPVPGRAAARAPAPPVSKASAPGASSPGGAGGPHPYAQCYCTAPGDCSNCTCGCGGTTGSTTTTGTSATGSTTSDPSTGASTGDTAGYTAGGGSAGDWDGSSSTISIDGVPDYGKVSGTNVNATFTLSMKRGSSQYDQVTLDGVVAQIGAEADSAITTLQARDLSPSGSSSTFSSTYAADLLETFNVRFASTRFRDGATVVLNARVTYHLSISGTNTQSPQYHYDVKPLHLIAYNKGLALDTKLIASCDRNVGYTVPNPLPDSYPWDSMNAIPSGGNDLRAVDRLDKNLPGQMNHALITSGPDLDKASVLSALNRMTAFFAYTHGETDGFFPSYGTSNPPDAPNAKDATAADKMVFSTQRGWDSEVGKAVWGDLTSATSMKRSVPLPNMVVLHACSGIGGGPDPALHAFGLLAPNIPLKNPDGTLNASVVDRGLGAFADVVTSTLSTDHPPKDATKTHLSNHAKQIYLYLAQGQTLYEAVAMTQDIKNGDGLVPFHNSCKEGDTSRSMKMDVWGDQAARLVSVYNGNLNPPKNGPLRGQSGGYPYEWYLVNP